ncbi:hypothetical protein [Okeania sp. SIO2C9]|uniref:hypothetical protein n=1 Tax=Okeania sp. SIO2C9 TaxID=2607791 RepID=UPI0025D5682B|nr:hypothetical protein [Okeania sp. SIO2C9]
MLSTSQWIIFLLGKDEMAIASLLSWNIKKGFGDQTPTKLQIIDRYRKLSQRLLLNFNL